ncbi:MAG: hypothetical protein VB144_05130, partial [Clostridia bacterium]|nr:hypothetical protein [Clostridia bacterium]
MTRRRGTLMMITACAVVLIGALSFATAPHTAGAPKGDERSVEITIYNADLALVKEKRPLQIPEGVSTLLFPDISARINPTTVSFLSLTSPRAVSVREQNYEYDLVEDAKLLQKFIGERITVTTRGGQAYTGCLLSGAKGSSPANIVMSAGPNGSGEIYTVHLGDIQSVKYPSLPEGLITRPTLAWLISNTSGATTHDCLVTYLTGGLSWSADYVAVIGPNDDKLDITGWVTITNESGATFKDAKLKLVAGDVNQVHEEMNYALDRAGGAKMTLAEAPAPFEEKPFFDYHMYTLQYPTTVKESQVKQIELLSGS